MFSELISFMDSFLEMGIPGYDCIIYHKGKCIFRHQNGYSDLKTKTPFSGKERYNIYSCSKPITVVAALQLYEKGLYKLSDNLSDYMPEFKEMYVKTDSGLRKAENQITIKDLFCMTAGFSYNLSSPELLKCVEETKGVCETREVMRYLAKEPLDFEPGERWQYSLCHDVLAAFTEVVSKVKFEEYVKKNIFDVLGMTNSTFLLPYEEIDSIATHYSFNYETNKADERSKIPDYRFGIKYASGGAGCVSTVEDYIKFLEGVRTRKLLKDETIKLMTTDSLTEKQKSTFNIENYTYGLGVRCPCDDLKSDFGWGGAAGAYLAIDCENEITLFYAQHLLASPNHHIRKNVLTIATKVIKENFK